MSKKRKLEDEPEFRELIEELKKQTPEQLERLQGWLDEEIAKEEQDEGSGSDDS